MMKPHKPLTTKQAIKLAGNVLLLAQAIGVTPSASAAMGKTPSNKTAISDQGYLRGDSMTNTCGQCQHFDVSTGPNLVASCETSMHQGAVSAR